MRTFHYHLHLVEQAADNIASLRNSHLGLFEGESIESI